MAIKDTSLTTLARFKTYGGVSNDAEDTLFEYLIDAASDFIQSYCDRTFKLTSHVDVVRGSGTQNLLLENWPIIGSVTLEENTAGDTTQDFDTVATDKYWTFKDEGYLEANGWNFAKVPEKYRVTYEAGYRVQQTTVTGEHIALPNDLELACWKLGWGLYNKRKADGTSSQDLGEYSVQFTAVLAGDPDLKQILDNYKRERL